MHILKIIFEISNERAADPILFSRITFLDKQSNLIW